MRVGILEVADKQASRYICYVPQNKSVLMSFGSECKSYWSYS